jgi:hypothetical protein
MFRWLVVASEIWVIEDARLCRDVLGVFLLLFPIPQATEGSRGFFGGADICWFSLIALLLSVGVSTVRVPRLDNVRRSSLGWSEVL